MAETGSPAGTHADDPELLAMASEGLIVGYFGYGSLVNRQTLRTKFLGVRRASVTGWRRFWLPRPAPQMALLSVRPEDDCPTEGVVVYDHADHLPAVDEREVGYHRRVVMPDRVRIEDAPPFAVPLFIYEARRETPDAADVGSRFLQSYLDAVLQGFLALYGREGVERFVAETEGFETEIVRDRAQPLYPRSVTLSPAEAEFFDALVATRGVRYVDPA